MSQRVNIGCVQWSVICSTKMYCVYLYLILFMDTGKQIDSDVPSVFQ